MRIVRTVPALRAALAEPRRSGLRIGLVPTMGAFHEGHLSLMAHAREGCDVVVVSLFVNPAQFNEAADLAAYPRDEEHDAALAQGAGVDLLFAPAAEEVYPAGFATTVSVAGVTEGLEGAHRGPAHFHGVTTIVAKLFNIVAPQVAYFGQKDAQQVLAIRRMARDLDFDIAIEAFPTVREDDGLALSSRNVHLSPAERAQATALPRALKAIEQAVLGGERDAEAALQRGREVLAGAGLEPEYLELVFPESLARAEHLDDGEVLALIAARIGATRLIDNQRIDVPPPAVSARRAA